MKHAVKLGLLLFIIISISSCKKPSNRELLVDKAWMLSGFTVNPPIREQSDLYTDLDSCEKDDIEYFYADGRYVWDKGAVPCDDEFDEGQKSNANWAFNEEQTEITIKYPEGDSETITIETLNDTLLVVSYTEDYGSITYKFTDTYKATY